MKNLKEDQFEKEYKNHIIQKVKREGGGYLWKVLETNGLFGTLPDAKHEIDSLIVRQLKELKEQEKQIIVQKSKLQRFESTKFILNIPNEINVYLEWASTYKKAHKAQIVRAAIEDYMCEDKDWKEYND